MWRTLSVAHANAPGPSPSCRSSSHWDSSDGPAGGSGPSWQDYGVSGIHQCAIFTYRWAESGSLSGGLHLPCLPLPLLLFLSPSTNRMLKQASSFVLASFRPSTLRKSFSEAGITVGAFPFAKIHSNGERPHKVRWVPPRGFTRGGLAWERRVSGRRVCLGRLRAGG